MEGLDQQNTIPFGTPEESAADVRRVIKALAPGGGYIFAPCHNLQLDIPPQNIAAIYCKAKEYGVHPIS